MQIKQLEIFDAIVRAGSVSAAARELGMTQSAVSRILAKFESELGFDLFNRRNGRLVPSSRSSLVLTRVRRVLEAVSELHDVKQDWAGKRPQALELVTVPSLAQGVIPRVLSEFSKTYPEIRIHLDVRTTQATIDSIIARQADFGLLTLPVSHQTLSVQPLMRMKSACVLPKGHRLADKTEITPKDLENEPLVLLTRRQPSRLLIDEAFRREGVKPFVRIETANVHAACQCTQEGLGITIANALMAGYSASTGMVIRSFGPQIHHTLALIEPAGKDRSPLTSGFLSCFYKDVLRMEQERCLNIEHLHDAHSFSE